MVWYFIYIRADQALHSSDIIVTIVLFVGMSFSLLVLFVFYVMAGPGLYVVAYEAADVPEEAETRRADREEGYYASSSNGNFDSFGHEYSSEYYYPYDLNNDYGPTDEYESGTHANHCILKTE